MPGPVRLVSDGEELVLSKGEAFRIRPRPGSAGPPRIAIAIRYLGFHDVGGRREYALRAQRGDEASDYVVSIELAAFANRQALMQDGPDICYQKLLRELAVPERRGDDGIVVTAGDLAAYRERHTPPARRKFPLPSPPRSTS